MMWKKRLQNISDNKAGVTLVELIVTFSLIGIFMAAASFMLSSSIQLFTRMQATSSAVTVSDFLLDKIAGEIAAAQEPSLDRNDEALRGYYFWMEKDEGSNWVAMCNRNGSPLAIYADYTDSPEDTDSPKEGVLCLKYYQTVKGDDTKSAEVKDVPEMNWQYDESVYMGYRITENGLTFTREDVENHPNVIRIDLEIHNDNTGFTYRAFRYAECYNYTFRLEQAQKYLCVRNDGAEGMPVKAEEFIIKDGEDSGGGTEEPDPDNPEPGDGRAKLTVIHKVIDGCNSTYAGKILKTEYLTERNSPAYSNEWPYIWINQLEDGKDPEGYGFLFTYNVNETTGIQGKEMGLNLRVEPDSSVTFVFYYIPKDTLYCCAAYEWGTNIELEAPLKKWENKIGINKQQVTVEAPETIFDIVDWRGTTTYQLVDGNGLPVERLRSTKILDFDYTYNTDAILRGPNNFMFFYKKIEQTETQVPYTVYYNCGSIKLDSFSGFGTLGERIQLKPKDINGYSPVVWYANLLLDKPDGVEFEFQYRMNRYDAAPFQPVGPQIEISVYPKREVSELEQQMAEDIYHLFYDNWEVIEVNGELTGWTYIKGAYRIFEYNETKYAIAGWTSTNLPWDNLLKEQVKERENIEYDKLVEIKHKSVSNQYDRKILLNYILKNAGATEEYIKDVKNINVVFNDNRNLEQISYKNGDGETVTITYKKLEE